MVGCFQCGSEEVNLACICVRTSLNYRLVAQVLALQVAILSIIHTIIFTNNVTTDNSQ